MVSSVGALLVEMANNKQHQGLLLPNEDAVIELTTHVDNEVASRLNLGTKDLDCTLILHTVMGKDHFISVTGEYGTRVP